jgi:putative ABC transport system permease protein
MEKNSPDAPFWRRYARFWGPDVTGDVRDEVRFHLEMKQAELEARGHAPEAARREAERSFGDVAGIQAELRAIGHRRERRVARSWALWELGSDLVQAWRAFRRRPGIPLVVVLTLGLGIGAGTAVFSLFDAVVANPLPVAAPEEVVVLGEGEPGARTGIGFPYPMVRLIREQVREATGIGGYLHLDAGIRAGEHREQTRVAVVTGEYFELLGVRPQVGRLLQPADEAAPGATPHVVLSDALWRRAYGADPGVVGQSIVVNEARFQVVGVAPPRFRGTSLAAPAELWLPITMVQSIGGGGLFSRPDVLETWFFGMITVLARLPAGAAPEPLVAELTALRRAALEGLAPGEGPAGAEDERVVVALPLTEWAAGRSREDLLRFLAVLAGVVGIGLAIACVNVANLLLIRTTERRRELAVRAAVGAAGGRLARQLLAENLLLGAAAGVLGLGVALAVMRVLTSFSLPGGIALGELALLLDLRALGYAAAVALVATVAFGAAPALAARRTRVVDALRSAAHGGRFRWRGGSVLLAAQVALSMVLLVAGFLFLRSLLAGLAVDLGFRSDGIGSAAVGLRQHGYDAERAQAFIDDVLARATSDPAVTSAAAAGWIPIDPGALRLPVRAAEGGPDGPPALLRVGNVTPGFFQLFGIRLLRGRDFGAEDRPGGRRVTVITAATAELLWPGADPLGRELALFGVPATVVGVVADAHFTRLTDREPVTFMPLAQNLGMTMERIHVAAAGSDAGAALRAVRAGIRGADPRLPIFAEGDVHGQLQAVLMPQRFGTLLLATFGGLALLISAVGIYAVAAFDVVRRRRELGIRAALGAGRRRIVGGVLRRSALAVACGAVAGTGAALVATRALQGLLFGIEATEPVSYTAAVLLMALVAALASWLPARRAAGVDPLLVVRE